MEAAPPKRYGVFGGTFDPVHLGHLVLAEQCREQARLDQVWFIPAARPPHKQDWSVTPFGQRVEMLALALAGNPAFAVDELEKDRAGPSYTVDTLDELRQRHPGATLALVIGSDCLPDLPHWHAPERLAELAELLIAARPGWPMWPVDQLRATLRTPAGTALHSQVISMPLLEISSRDLRPRATEGRSLRYLVPRAVQCYIDQHRVYAPEGARRERKG